MTLFWFYFRAFWHGFFRMFDSQEQRLDYAEREADKYLQKEIK